MRCIKKYWNSDLFKRYGRLACVSIILAVITYLYFLVPLSFFPDSLGYYSYVKIFQGIVPVSAWDMMRGPSLPLLLYLAVSLFGSAMFGILVMTYGFFVGLLAVFYITLKKVFYLLKSNRIEKNIALAIFIFIIVLNPILFGYYHSLLTEFVACFLSFLSCALAWIWLKKDFVSSRLKYIISSLLFVFLFIFVWFLKQPYLTLVLAPILIATIISFVSDHSRKNILQRATTLLLCVVGLFVSLNCWQHFLVYKGVDQKKVSDTNSSYLAGGIIKGISNVNYDMSLPITDSDINKANISSVEKNKLNKAVGSGSKVYLATIKSHNGSVIDKMYFSQVDNVLSVKDSLYILAKITVKHPFVVIDSYVSNYLAAIDLYDFITQPGTGVMTPIKTVTIAGHENYSIGMQYLHHGSNVNMWSSQKIDYGDLVEIPNDNNKVVRFFYGTAWKLHQAIFIGLFLILPLLFIFVIIGFIKVRKIKANKSDKLKRVYELLIIIFGSALFNALFQSCLGAMIDRYLYVTFPSVAFGVIVLFLIMARKIRFSCTSAKQVS